MKEFKIQKKFLKEITDFSRKTDFSLYRKLVYNNINDTCSKAFPITKSLLKKRWSELIEEFIKEAEFRTPYLWEIPKEFIEFCKRKKVSEVYNIPFLYDLLEFEWIEIELFNRDIPKEETEFNWNRKLFLSNSSQLKVFNYPVHRIGDIPLEDLKNYKDKYYLILYVSPEDYEVSYFQITQFLYDILNIAGSASMLEIVKKVSKAYSVELKDIIDELENFFLMLCRERILV